MINATKTIERAKRKLGHPLIKIELTDEQMTSLLKDAQDTFYLYAELCDMPVEKQDRIEDTWIKKYFYALCKETLGRIRGKFDGKLSIPGTDLTLDYESLLAESEREKCLLKYAIFQEKELLSCAQTQNAVFVFYVNIGNLSAQDVEKHLEALTNKFKKPGFTNYFIPISEGQTRVECIYPVSEKFDEQGKHVIQKLNDYLENVLKKEENVVGKEVTLDLGGIGPSKLTVESVDEALGVVSLKYDSGKVIELSISEFEELSGIKIYKDNE